MTQTVEARRRTPRRTPGAHTAGGRSRTTRASRLLAGRRPPGTVTTMTRRLLAVTTALTLTGLTLATAPVHAATTETQNCTAGADQARTVNPGDTLTITVGTDCATLTADAALTGTLTVSGTPVTAGQVAVPVTAGQVVVYTAPGSATIAGLTEFTLASAGDTVTDPYVITTPATAPAAVATPIPTISGVDAVVTWTAPETGGSAITDYVVQYSTNAGSSWTILADGVSTTATATLSGLSTSSTYVFRVAAVNAIGTGTYSAASASVTPVAPPAAPTAASATLAGTTVTLTWSAPSVGGPLTDYLVAYSTTSGSTWTAVSRATSTTTSAVLTDLPAASYVFRVAAVNAGGTGPYSTSSSSITIAGAPSAPTGVRATRTNGVITLAWTAPSGTITSYSAQYSTTSGATWTALALASGTATTASISTLTDPGTYLFRVAATTAGGTSAYSTASTGLTIADTTTTTSAAAPTGITGTPTSTGIALTWTAPAGVTGITDYTVEYSTTGTTWTTWKHAASPAAKAAITGLTASTKYLVRVTTVTTTAGTPSTPITVTTLTADGKPGTGTPTTPGTDTPAAIGTAPAGADATPVSSARPSAKPDTAPKVTLAAGTVYQVRTRVDRKAGRGKAAASIQVAGVWTVLGKVVIKKNGKVTLPAITATTAGEYLLKIKAGTKAPRYLTLVVT